MRDRLRALARHRAENSNRNVCPACRAYRPRMKQEREAIIESQLAGLAQHVGERRSAHNPLGLCDFIRPQTDGALWNIKNRADLLADGVVDITARAGSRGLSFRPGQPRAYVFGLGRRRPIGPRTAQGL